MEEPEHRMSRINNITNEFNLQCHTLESYPSIVKIVSEVMHDDFYHLATQSFYSYSFEDEFSTINTNINGTHFVLAALNLVNPTCRFYFAGSSEMFGKVAEVPQNESTHFHPRSPYGISKVTGYDLTRNYRESNNIFACSGILYNHESPKRGFEFVTRKITSHVAKI